MRAFQNLEPVLQVIAPATFHKNAFNMCPQLAWPINKQPSDLLLAQKSQRPHYVNSTQSNPGSSQLLLPQTFRLTLLISSGLAQPE